MSLSSSLTPRAILPTAPTSMTGSFFCFAFFSSLFLDATRDPAYYIPDILETEAEARLEYTDKQ